MASKADIKKVIMDIAGNPESGPVKNLADQWADAIVALDAPAPARKIVREDEEPVKETRVIRSSEKR